MNATSTAQKTVLNPPSAAIKGSAKGSEESNSFSDMMAKLKEKTQKMQIDASPEVSAKTKIKAESKGVDLSFLGELSDKDAVSGPVKLSDILASISHETAPAKGTEVINFKNILAASNDDPNLINADLINLLPKENRSKISQELINGVKQEVKGRLGRIIPAERIPTTLKGMLETAIRLDIKVDNIKLETIPHNKAAKELLTLFTLNEKALASLPQAKVMINEKESLPTLSKKTVKTEGSPLQKMLEQHTAVKAESNPVTTASEKSIKASIVPEGKVLEAEKGTNKKDENLIAVKDAIPNVSVKKTNTEQLAPNVSVKKTNTEQLAPKIVEEDKSVKVLKNKLEDLATNESSSESLSDDEMVKTSKPLLTGEVGRRLNKKSASKERVDLEIGKDIETKKNVITQDVKQTMLAQNENIQKSGAGKRIDLPLAKVSNDKEEKKSESKATAKEEKLTLAEGKALRSDLSSIRQTVEKPLANEVVAQQERKNLATEEVAEEKSESSTHVSKSDAVQKAESNLTSKLVEGKQLVSQLSSDIKEAMENYKPPFTKLTMKLRPEKLGEIDVVMVQRGNNVHINLSSNSAALTMLQQQSGDLKAALTDLGLGDASMKFTQSDQGKQQQAPHHSANDRYKEIAKLEETVDMLELIVPRYV